ncbi:hypothetical protein L2E82_31386 [Cichorium intybus]|uniref:Uncharacterized protein n=1 Tax=Cichorium intybus TaxID=13427 RepID=A0ACB9D326_CICIN|nr:hypothetical protein L2E82_31386 [Cichorium intybus]
MAAGRVTGQAASHTQCIHPNNMRERERDITERGQSCSVSDKPAGFQPLHRDAVEERKEECCSGDVVNPGGVRSGGRNELNLQWRHNATTLSGRYRLGTELDAGTRWDLIDPSSRSVLRR